MNEPEVEPSTPDPASGATEREWLLGLWLADHGPVEPLLAYPPGFRPLFMDLENPPERIWP